MFGYYTVDKYLYVFDVRTDKYVPMNEDESIIGTWKHSEKALILARA